MTTVVAPIISLTGSQTITPLLEKSSLEGVESIPFETLSV